jgi:hypothetical protein
MDAQSHRAHHPLSLGAVLPRRPAPSPGASDAYRAPYHVSWSQIVVRKRLALRSLIDAERVARAIELTHFPVPADDDHAETDA